MTFKKKVHQKIKAHTGLYKSNLTKEISELADDYAIGFAEWVNCSKTYYTPMNELLEIFKKEKGL